MKSLPKFLLAALIGLLATNGVAFAGTTTYVWVTTSKSVPFPNMSFDASYTLIDGYPFPTVSSDDPVYDFGGLVDLYAFGGYGYQYPMTLADLTRPCDDFVDPYCYAVGFPMWIISEDYWKYIDTYDSYEYIYDGTSFTALSDGGCRSDVDGHRECVWYGYFTSAPEPATLSLMLLALPLLALRKARKATQPS